jgi:hypothetical protein
VGAATTFTYESGFGNYCNYAASNGKHIYANDYSNSGLAKYGTGYNSTTLGTSYGTGILTSLFAGSGATTSIAMTRLSKYIYSLVSPPL